MVRKKIVLTLGILLYSCQTSTYFSTDKSVKTIVQKYSYNDKVFETKALAEGYLRKKIESYASLPETPEKSKALVKEIYYAKYKHPDLLKDIIAETPELFDDIDANPLVTQKKAESPFLDYINYIRPFDSGAPSALDESDVTTTSFIANWESFNGATGYILTVTNTDLNTSVEYEPGNVTSFELTNLLSDTNYSYTVKAKNGGVVSPASNSITVKTPVITSGLQGLYTFSGNANDTSGNGRNGSLSASPPVPVADRFGNAGKAYNFGANRHISLGTWFNFNNFTISVWAKLTSTPAGVHSMIDNNHTASRNFTIQSVSGDATFHFLTKTEISTSVQGGATTLPLNEWVHLVFVKDGTSQRIYQNNVLVNTTTVGNTMGYSATSLSIGKWGGGSRFFYGDMDDIAFYNRALSDTEINSLYKK